jgi:hypothetical protein
LEQQWATDHNVHCEYARKGQQSMMASGARYSSDAAQRTDMYRTIS